MALRKTIICDQCAGHGVVADYGPLGLDFEGPKECDCCEGNGKLLVTKAKRLMTLGGKFRGRL